MRNLTDVQAFMREQRIDAWLLFDFRGSNPIFAQLLGGKPRHTTRRAFLHIPAAGEPRLLASVLDGPALADAPGRIENYIAWTELRAWLTTTIAAGRRIAMEYSPGGALPVVSAVDGGTLDLLRALGAEVVSSADLIQVCVARWTDAAFREHQRTSQRVAEIKDSAFGLIRQRVAAQEPVSELDVQRHILTQFDAAGLEYPDPPIVAVNAHSGDPHFEVSQTSPAPIRLNDWVLIDLWARTPGDENIYADITWVGYVGRAVPPRQGEVFAAVKEARDAAAARATDAWKARRPVAGFELDDAARDRLVARGLQPFIRHRTGHSLSPGRMVHGLGVNLDNLETHDTRLVLPGLGFTIEPGAYLPEFGVRLEINVYVHPETGPTITSCVQDDVLRLA